MAYQDYTETGKAAQVRQRRASSPQSETTTRRKRRKKRKQVRFDLIFLTAVALLLIVVLAMPGDREQPPTPTDETTLNIPQPSQTTAPTLPPETEPPVTVYVPVPQTFTEADAELVYARTSALCSGKADVESALLRELDWDLTDPDFTVLIIHSHISESYTLTADQVPDESSSFTSDPYRTDDERYNMVAIGQQVAEILRENGIHVIHDTTSFENPNSDHAYRNAKEYLEDLLAENPNIGLIIDLHRDAVENEDGSQWAPTVVVDGKECAKISMAIGYPNEYNSAWNRNLSFAVKLGALMNRGKDSTLFRQLFVTTTTYNYNQYLGPVSMLIEVGTAGNSVQESLNAAEQLAHAIVELSRGANLEG